MMFIDTCERGMKFENNRLTTNFWNTETIMLIQKLDNSYALGVNVRYENPKNAFKIETREIHLDDNNIPYVLVDSPSHDFTKENCSNKIIKQATDIWTVEGYPIATLETDSIGPDSTRSVFAFVDKCISRDKVRQYFSQYYRTVSLNENGLAILLKCINTPEMQKKLSERLVAPSQEQIKSLEESIRNRLEDYFDSKSYSAKMSVSNLLEKHNALVDRKSLDPDKIISIDLNEFNHLLDNSALPV